MKTIKLKKFISIFLIILMLAPFTGLQASASLRTIIPGATYDGSLSTATPINQYAVNITQAGYIAVKFEFPSTAPADSWQIIIYTEGGSAPLLSTNFGGDSGKTERTTLTEYTESVSVKSGRYMISVSTPYGSAIFPATYKISVEFSTAPIAALTVGSIEEAAELELNADISGSIQSKDDADYFKFKLPSPGSVNINFAVSSAIDSGSWSVILYDENQKQLQKARTGSGGTVSGSMRINKLDKQRLPAGDYLIKVEPHTVTAVNTAEYKLNVTYSPEPGSGYEKKPSDNIKTADSISLNAPIIGNLNNSDDQSYFKFNISEFKDIKIEFAVPESVNRTAWTIALFKDEKSIATHHVGQIGTVTNKQRVFTSSIINLDTGDYFIAVLPHSADDYSNEDYTLCIRADGAPVPPGQQPAENPADSKPGANNTPQTASPLLINTDVTSNLSHINDLNYFKINISESKDIQIKFSIDNTINHNYWAIKLFDSDLTEIKSYRIGEGGVIAQGGLKYFKTERINLTAGDYFVLISPWAVHEYSNGEYILKVVDAIGQRIDIYNFEADKPSSWALREVEFAYGYDLVPAKYLRDFKTNIKRGEFCELAVKFLETAEAKPISEILALRGKAVTESVFTDTSEQYILAAYVLGIVTGRGGGIFDPGGNITREEAAAMLMRLAVLADIKMNASALSFNDTQKFNSWAAEAIAYVSSCIDSSGSRVMNGYTDGGFHPGDFYSREQAYMTMFRLFSVKKGLK